MNRFSNSLDRYTATRSADFSPLQRQLPRDAKLFPLSSVVRWLTRTKVRAPFDWLLRSLNAVLLLSISGFTGCESTDGGGTSQVSGSIYYGVGFYDPWYYGDYHDHGDIIVTPPPGGSGHPNPPGPDRPVPPPRPEHPIAKPPPASRPPTASPRSAARPMPSIPSAPRPMARPAGRR